VHGNGHNNHGRITHLYPPYAMNRQDRTKVKLGCYLRCELLQLSVRSVFPSLIFQSQNLMPVIWGANGSFKDNYSTAIISPHRIHKVSNIQRSAMNASDNDWSQSGSVSCGHGCPLRAVAQACGRT
jgi:hypothetical protein